MGARTHTNIAAWQQHAGLTPATPKQTEALCGLQNLALDLIKVCELEKSGIRDGDGYWYGCDPLGEIARKIGAFTMPPTDDRDRHDAVSALVRAANGH